MPLKTFVPIEVTDAGIEIAANDLAPVKANEEIVVSLSGKVIFVIPYKPRNALAPI